VVEVVEEASEAGQCDVEVMERALEAFFLAARRVRSDALEERLLFRTTEADDLVRVDRDLSLKDGPPDEVAETTGQSARRVIAPIPEINALAGDYLIHRPKHATRPLVLHRTLTPEVFERTVGIDDDRFELIGHSLADLAHRQEERDRGEE
jgi:hypothetical protein